MSNEMKHTPEPWEVGRSWCGHYPAITKQFRPDHNVDICGNVHGYMYAPDKFGCTTAENQQANAARIVDCVNALEGIENPEEWVRKAKEALNGRG